MRLIIEEGHYSFDPHYNIGSELSYYHGFNYPYSDEDDDDYFPEKDDRCDVKRNR
jgi:hypothetical protein